MEIILEAIDYDYLGRGISYKDGKTYFVKNLLKGEIGKCLILKEKNNLSFCECIKIVKKSPNRSDYSYEDITNLSHLNFDEQLYFQELITQKTLDKFKINYKKIYPIVYSNDYIKYRNKATFYADSSTYTTFGNYFNDTNTFTTFKNITLPNEINELVISFNNYFKDNNLKLPEISKIIVRINQDNKLMLVIYSTKLLENKFYERFIDSFNIISVYNIVKSHKILLYGDKYLKYNIKDINYFIGPTSFFQVNTKIIGVMYDLVKEEANESKNLIDAFSGIASISKYIIEDNKMIYSIEKNKESCEIAKISNNCNIKIINADFFKVYDKYLKLADTLIIDPPREGLDIKSCNIIKDSNIKKIIYLSCNIRTLSRDLEILQEKYIIKKIIPIKNFWQTAECETLAILSINS